MYKKKSLFVTFEGIEGSGKSYQSKKLFRKIKSMRLPAIYTREPGGTRAAEKIRKVILEDYFHPDSEEKFNKYTDTLLYLAARNEHIEKKLLYVIDLSILRWLIKFMGKECIKVWWILFINIFWEI